MELRNSILYVLIFTLGVISASLIYEVGKINSETPLAAISNPADTISNTLSAVTTGKSIERSSPGDHISESQIKVYNDMVQLDIPNARWSKFADTNSMDPVLDTGSNGIEVVPTNESQIKLGDIISYQDSDGIIIHRVIGINSDEQGIYYIVKGDNNPVQDPAKVRFSQIKGILVGIIY